MVNRKTKRALAKNFPPAFAITDVTNGNEYALHIASQQGRPVLVISKKDDVIMAIPALQVIEATAVMMEEAYTKASEK